MSNHGLTRNTDKEAVCLCGYRPEILDDFRPLTERQLKAKTTVLEHVQARNHETEVVRFTKEALGITLTPWQENILNAIVPAQTPLRSPNDPFLVTDARYPRAGVRRTEDGRWLLSCWDGEQIVHVIDQPIFDDRVTAFDYGWLTIGACRESGTNLNGMEAA